jgi:hypothetical protein
MKTNWLIFPIITAWFLLLSRCSQNPISSGIERTISVVTSTSTSTVIKDKPTSGFMTPTLVYKIATSTPTPTPTLVTPNVRATLTISDSVTDVISLLKNNGGCELPCVWEIMPGKTKLDDARRYFENLGWKGDIYPKMPRGPVYYTGVDLNNELTIRVALYYKDGIVDTLSFDAGGPEFFQLVQYLSPQNIMDKFAEPDQVWINLATNLELSYPEITEYGIYIYYTSPNILLHYTGNAKKHGDSYRICPKNSFLA